MKFLAISLLATWAIASPISAPEPITEPTLADIQARQLGSSKNELETGSAGSCPRAILIFARGSTETGNLGTLGAPLGDALERKYGAANFWVQGVGGPYDAALADNFLPRGSSAAAINEAVRLFNLANSKCPSTPVVAGGYSQGAALMAAAISDLSTNVRNTVVGTVLFGYTKNQQNRGAIPNYPQDRLRVFCAPGDLVCDGSLTITPAHLSYSDEARTEAPQFLISKIGN